MVSLMHGLRSLLVTIMMITSLTPYVLAQPTTLDPGLSKLANQKLADYEKRVNDIKDKTADPGAQEKQIQKVADEAGADGVKFIEDAGAKRFATKEEIDRATGEYVYDLLLLFKTKRLCPFLTKLVGPGGKYRDVLEDAWSRIRRAYNEYCVEKPTTTKPPGGGGGGIKIGGGGGEPGDTGAPCPEGYPLLEDCVKQHNLDVFLYGDGQTTSNCTLVISDKAGHASTATIKTVCASKKSLSPPVNKDKASNENLSYTVVTGKNPKALALVNTAQDLEKQGKFNDVTLNPEKRCSTISQLAIWKDCGGSTPGNKDAVTRESIKTDMLHKAGVSPNSLTKEEDKQLTNRVDAICAAVDLTLKECPQTGEKTKDKESLVPLVPMDGRNILVGYHHDSKLAQVRVANGHCCIPAGTVFVPSKKEKYQEMMCVEDQVFDCPPGINDGLISAGCTWVFGKYILIPKNPYNARTEGDKYDAFENEQATRITDELEKLAEVSGDMIDEDEEAHTTDKFNDFTIVLLYLCVEKGKPRSAKHAIISKEEAKHFDPEGDLEKRKANKDARKTIIDKHRPGAT